MNSCDFKDFPDALLQAIATRKIKQNVFLKAVGKIVKNETKNMIGHEQSGFPPLADSTKADRVSKGYPENEPLLREGHLRESTNYEVDMGVRSKHVDIGYEKGRGVDEYAKAQEEGSGKIPPRPYLKAAAMKKAKDIHEVTGILGTIFTSAALKSGG